jgi:hypothetical protein
MKNKTRCLTSKICKHQQKSRNVIGQPAICDDSENQVKDLISQENTENTCKKQMNKYFWTVGTILSDLREYVGGLGQHESIRSLEYSYVHK